MKKAYLVVDGNNLLIRSYNKFLGRLRSRSGIVVGSVYHFLKDLAWVKEQIPNKIDEIVVAFGRGSSRRGEVLYNYFNRGRFVSDLSYEELLHSIPSISHLLRYLGVTVVLSDNHDSVDVLNDWVSLHKNHTNLVYSHNLALSQIVEDGKVLLIVPSGKKLIYLDEDKVVDRFQVPARKLLTLLSIFPNQEYNLDRVRVPLFSGSKLIQEINSVHDSKELLNRIGCKSLEGLPIISKIAEKSVDKLLLNYNILSLTNNTNFTTFPGIAYNFLKFIEIYNYYDIGQVSRDLNAIDKSFNAKRSGFYKSN